MNSQAHDLPTQIHAIRAALPPLSEQLVDAYMEVEQEETAFPAEMMPYQPQLLAPALRDLLDHLDRLTDPGAEAPGAAPLDDHELNQLVDYGLLLLDYSVHWAHLLERADLTQGFLRLALGLALWAQPQGVEFSVLQPLVNGLSALANQTADPQELASLYRYMTDIINSVDPRVIEDADPADPQDHWRLLLINRGIVATRTHRESLMQEAFDAIVEALPGQAMGFFQEGMAEMHRLDYPPQVQRLIAAYLQRWQDPRVLH